MISLELGHSVKIAEDQAEYNTLHGTVHKIDIQYPPSPEKPEGEIVQARAVTVAFKFDKEELEKLVENDGVFYYTQVLGPSQMHPMNINVINPLPEDLQ